MTAGTFGRTAATGGADSAWLWPLLLGAGTVILGIVLLVNPFASAKTLAVLVALGVFVHGVVDVLRSRRSPHPVATLIAGGLLVIGGLVALVWPGITLWVLAVVVGLSLILGGLVKSAAAVVDRKHFGAWGLLLASGVVSVLFGILALAWPTATVVVLAVVFGLQIMLVGFIEMIAALKVRQATLR